MTRKVGATSITKTMATIHPFLALNGCDIVENGFKINLQMDHLQVIYDKHTYQRYSILVLTITYG